MAGVIDGSPVMARCCDRLDQDLQLFLMRNEGRSVAVLNEWSYGIKGQVRSFLDVDGRVKWGVFFDEGDLGHHAALFRLTATQLSVASTLKAQIIVLLGSPKESWWYAPS